MQKNVNSQMLSFGEAVKAGLIGGIIAAFINSLLFFLGQALNGGVLELTDGPVAELSIFMVLMASIIPGIVAGLIYLVIHRFTVKPRRWFIVLAAVIFILSVFQPISAASNPIVLGTLEMMHLGAASAIVLFILRATQND